MRAHFYMDVDLADRIIGSMLVNGDTNPDVIVIAAQTVQLSRTGIDTALVVDAIEAEGHTVNEDWSVDFDD